MDAENWVSFLDGVFEGYRRLEAKSAVESHGFVEGFDLVKDHGVGLVSSGRDDAMEAFGFQFGPERLHGGVIMAVGRAAHAGGDAAQLQPAAELGAGVLAAAVGCGRAGRFALNREFAGRAPRRRWAVRWRDHHVSSSRGCGGYRGPSLRLAYPWFRMRVKQTANVWQHKARCS